MLVLKTILILSLVLFNDELNKAHTENSSIEAINSQKSYPSPSLSFNNLSQTGVTISGNAFNVEDALPPGYVKDGSIDYTDYIQKAIYRYKELVFPGFPILVNDSGLLIPSDRKIRFMNGSRLKLKASAKSRYSIIEIKNASNVTLIDPYIVGDRYSHLGTSGEWGHGISISGSENINIINARVYYCWGDGIYIGKSIKSTNRNITLTKPYCRSNRRDGISIIDADGLKIISAYAGYSDGTAPCSGINIEPNAPTNEINNIEIINPVTEKNKSSGIQAGIGNLYGRNNKYVNISIVNHTDIGSGTAILSSCRTGKRKGNEIISGTLTISGATWQKNSVQPVNLFSGEPNFRYIISRPQVINTSGAVLSAAQTKAVLEHNKSIWRPTRYFLSFK